MTKRAFDLAVSSLALLAVAPLLLVLAILVKLSSPGPVLFRQERVGRNFRRFRINKFRTMVVDAPHRGGQITVGEDPRVTRVGRFLRKTKLDELPQLFNVLLGEMSFVGPRPERPQFVEELTAQIPYFNERHRVKPGITGWAQICYPYGASLEDAEEKLKYDLYYIKNHSLFFDLFILVRTVEIILLGSGVR